MRKVLATLAATAFLAVAAYAGEQVPARHPGQNGLPALGDAPGTFVKM